MNWNEDEWQAGIVDHPKYIVASNKIAVPFYRLLFAEKWKEYFYNTYGLILNIIDLHDYDWKLNPKNINFHRLKTN